MPGAEVRNLAANGEVWTGRGAEIRRLFPAIEALANDDTPDENACSAAVRLRYGAFSYFAVGDLTSQSFDGTLPWRDLETPAAQAAGPVDVAAHRGMFDATGADVVRALRPRAWIIPAWNAAHPSPDALERMLNLRLYPGLRDVFATGVSPASELAHKWLIDRLAAREGHVIVRVDAGHRDRDGALTQDASVSYADLGHRVGLSAPAVHDRVKKLRASGCLRQTAALLDGPAIGKPLLAFIHVDAAGWGGDPSIHGDR